MEVFRAKNLGLGQLRMFLISEIRKIFIKLRQAFVETPIPNYFNLEGHI